MDNKKSLRTVSIIGTILGSLMIVLSVIAIISVPLIYFIILPILVANLLIALAGRLGIKAAASSPDVNTNCCSVTACMVLSIIAAFLHLSVFMYYLLTLLIGIGSYSWFFIIILVILLFSATELVVSIWSAVYCARLGACRCCPQQQAQMVGQAVHYVPNQNGTMSTVQGTPAGMNQACSSTTSGVVQPIQAQAQASKYPPPYPGKEAGPTETNPPPYPGNPPPYPGKEAGPTETNPPPYPGEEAGPTETNVPL